MTPSRFISLSLAALCGTVVLLGLGVWQLQRMDWKQDLLEKLQSRASAPPIAMAQAVEMSTRSNGDIRFIRVHARGRYRHDAEIHLHGIQNKQAGWRVITPFETVEGQVVLVIRGFVPEAFKSPETRSAGQVTDTVSIVGQVRYGETQTMFVPDNNPGANQWYWRDLAAMQEAARKSARLTAVGFYLDLETPGHSAEWPRPQPLAAAGLHNRHFGYALTWFGLAGALVAVYGLLLRSRMKA